MAATPHTRIAGLIRRLRFALPRHAPLHVCEMVQHCIVRLEQILSAAIAAPDAEHEIRHGEQLLLLCQDYQTQRLTAVVAEDE